MADRIVWLTEAREAEMQNPLFAKEYRRVTLATNLAREIRDKRQAVGMTQAQLASILATKQSVISRVEAGEVLPSLNFLFDIAYALGWNIQLEFKKLDDDNAA